MAKLRRKLRRPVIAAGKPLKTTGKPLSLKMHILSHNAENNNSEQEVFEADKR